MRLAQCPHGGSRGAGLPHWRLKRLQLVSSAALRHNLRLIRALASGDDLERLQEVTRRAAELRSEQQELGALVNELGAAFDGLPATERQAVLSALGAPPAVVAAVSEDQRAQHPDVMGDRGLDAMTSSAQTAMEVARITNPQLWAQPDSAGVKGLAAEAEALARRLEDGEPLPPPPPGELVGPAEPAEQFLARMRESVARFEARVAGRKGRRDAERGDDGAEQQWHGPFSDVPIFPKELSGTLPAPDQPPAAQAQWQRVQRIAYVLRRAHLSQDPTAPLGALRSRGLVADDLAFEDPWLDLVGVARAEEYLGRVGAAGGRFEVDSVFLTCEQFDPPQWRFVADVFLNLPLPRWYLDYLAFHGEGEAEGAGAMPGRNDYGQPGSGIPPGGIYPRGETAPSQAEEDGTAHLPWMRWPDPLACAARVRVRNPAGFAGAANPQGTKQAAQREGEEIASRAAEEAERTGRLPFPAGAAGARWRPSYAALPSAAGILETSRWELEGRPSVAQPPPPPPPLPRPAPADLGREPLTPGEAEHLLRLLLGDKFEAAMTPLPKPGKGPSRRRDGMEWQGGRVLTAVVTFFYEVDAERGQVVAISSHWDGVGGPFSDPREGYDVYLAACGLPEWDVGVQE